MANAKRKALPKKLRFEVFKRDSFTCQYCGRMAPDVVLEVDHVIPVAEGGTNDIMNLITSCFDCNRGKGKNRLSESGEMKKQQERLKELNQKREQIEMMLKWRSELSDFQEEQVDKVEMLYASSCSGAGFNMEERKTISKLIERYGFIEVYDCTKISAETYYDPQNPGSDLVVFNYISRICYNRKMQSEIPVLKDVNYIVKIVKNRLAYSNPYRLKEFLCRHMSVDDIENVKEIATESRNWTDLKSRLCEYFNAEGEL